MSNYSIVVASTNTGKIKEISEMLKNIEGIKINVSSLQDYSLNNNSEPDEPHENFMENATHKAKHYASLTKQATLSDDSGLCIEALNGFPGIRTKEFVEKCGGIDNAFLKLENMLKGQHNFRAYFNSATVLYVPTEDYLITHEAKDSGLICFPPRGNAGFAFDPIFIPDGYTKTFAELGLAKKNQISHRAKAIQGLIKKLKVFLSD